LVTIERNSREILRRLRGDDWGEVGANGSHHKLKHPDGRVIIVPHPKKDLPLGTARAIAKHAGWLKE
jgi:predicted RNA binding protein YcfA (HicA-like mRNA interferase family)